jgi:acyl-CoA reductase-like NAD-dependent aldehyde dehydrogenase
MSSSGTKIFSAARQRDAAVANANENSSENAEREKHAQRRAQQVVRQLPGIERQRQRIAQLVRPRHLRAAVAEQHQAGQHQRQQRPVPAVARLDHLPGEEILLESHKP